MKKSFEMFPAVIKFIEEYGMLKVYAPISAKIPEADIIRYGFNRFRLHTTDLTNYIINGFASRSYVKEYEEYIEEKLVTVGKLIDGDSTLMISESGKLFNDYGFYDNNAEEFWDRLIDNLAAINWQAWDGW